jgi:hypothetical protein
MAAEAIQKAFHRQDFRARRFRRYGIQRFRCTRPIVALIRRFYDPAFLDLFFAPRPPRRLHQAVLWVLSGAIVTHYPFWVRVYLGCFFIVNTARKVYRWASGMPTASHWRW